jgi:hypothetical protein
MRHFLAARKYTFLLVVAVLAETLQPLARGLVQGLLYDGLVALLMLSVFLVVFEGRLQRAIGLCLSLPALATNWLHYLVPPQKWVPLDLVYHAFGCALFFYATIIILSTIFRRQDVTVDAVLGTVCGYLLAGAAFANLFTATELLQPGSFNIGTAIGGELSSWHARRFLFGYFSFVTLTTMGYGDITPVTPGAVSLSWLEAVFGQFYMAVVVAQLVGIRIGQRLGAQPLPEEKR